MKRRKLSKSEREGIYNLFNGHCAYCGCEIKYEEMQVDHIIAIESKEKGKDEIENMFPACRSCNHYKSTMSLEVFRKQLERMPRVLIRDSVTYKNAVRYGLVIPNEHKVEFYFEKNKLK